MDRRGAYSKYGKPEEDHMLLQDLEPAGEGHEYRRADSRRTLIERIPDILVIHV